MAIRDGLALTLASGVAEWAVPGLLALLRGTSSLTVIGRRAYEDHVLDGRPAVGAFWHRQVVVCGLLFSRVRTAIMVSQSKDGEIAARALARTRLRAVRGSSSRGGREALREIIDLLHGGWRIGFACDGPRGPSREVKMGCLVAAQRARAPLVPMAAAAHPSVALNSWDRTVIPLPGARAVIRLDEPVEIPPDASKPEMEALRARIESRMRAMEDECERFVRS